MARTRKTAAAEADKAKESPPEAAERDAWIAIAAYYLAESRGFGPGSEMADWLEAERLYLDRMGAQPS